MFSWNASSGWVTFLARLPAKPDGSDMQRYAQEQFIPGDHQSRAKVHQMNDRSKQTPDRQKRHGLTKSPIGRTN